MAYRKPAKEPISLETVPWKRGPIVGHGVLPGHLLTPQIKRSQLVKGAEIAEPRQVRSGANR